MNRDLFYYLPGIIICSALILLGFIWYESTATKQIYLNEVKHNLLVRANLLKHSVEKSLIAAGGSNAAAAYCDAVHRYSDARITLIAPDGKVIYDSDLEATRLPIHSSRPEIIGAQNGNPAFSDRFSSTLNQRMVYAAVPIANADKTGYYVLRVATSFHVMDTMLNSSRYQIILAVLMTAGLVALISFTVINRLSHAISALRNSAAKIAAGNFDVKLPVTSSGAIRALSFSLNEMAEQLKQRIHEITDKKNERDVIFANMTEGVIAVDLNGMILDINAAAIKIFDLPASAVGLSFFSVIRDQQIHEFLRQVIREKKIIECEITLHSVQERYLRARGAVIKIDDDNINAALIVVSDFSRIKKLEAFRRDFIADVSHEIKTPLTAINGAVETLKDGAINDHEAAQAFMDIISRQADRMNSLVKDILSLSELERRELGDAVHFEIINIADPVHNAIEYCRQRAEEKKIIIDVPTMPELKITGDLQLLEQAVINLIENAIRYNPEGSTIIIAAYEHNHQACISVADNGCGIESEHLPRLFERFYRVDRARSRKLGGTGLGLAIVKHIAQVHKGTAAVESTVGKGSNFTISIPLAKTS